MNNQKKPISVFDSGIGGLTAMKELLKLLPHEDIAYFGDTPAFRMAHIVLRQ